ncbi:hybrid sensor histidine kinase/response regulator transcription factor [Mucilaginibacter glaciei]|uniref:histidine kinase n=1 Tax=Mucilaginibacter glaciei TaxID=2772109 RepID=A0A926NNI3_9SPHI|nr:hybrid sensor histidine kinase/response regulator transcription factor [Mucilaginibacter glaciei]MBD1395354.1 response regulator [Mucilaginibacter glaciei]
MKRVIVIFLIALLGIVIPGFAVAQHNQYQFSRLTVNSGLSNSRVTSMVNDSKGFIWFGTAAGLNRFDGLKFKTYRHLNNDTTTLSDDNILNVIEAADKKLWIKTRSTYNIYDPYHEYFIRDVKKYIGKSAPQMSFIVNVFKSSNNKLILVDADDRIFLYDPITKKASLVCQKSNPSLGIINSVITAVSMDQYGDYWLMHYNGVLEKFDVKLNKVTYRMALSSGKLKKDGYYSFYKDADKNLWIYSPGACNGIFCFDPLKLALNHFDTQSANGRLNSNIVNSVSQDKDGIIWIATDHGGLNLLNKCDFSVRFLTNRENDDKSLGQNSIVSVFRDNLGIMWAGTFKKGLSFYHKNIIRFPLVQHHLSDPASLPFSDVNRFAEDAKGNLWIGSNGGGLIYFNRTTGKYTQFKHDAANPNSLSNNVIVSLCIDHKQRLWIGSFFGGLDCFDGTTFKHYRHDDANPSSISDDRVWEIFEDSSFNLWVGTLFNGLNRFDEKRKTFYHYKTGSGNAIHSNYITSILEDKQQNLWLGTSQGIDRMDKKTGYIKHFAHDSRTATSLINNEVRSLYHDSRGWIWAPTREGLSLLNPVTGIFKNFCKDDGLPDNNVLDIVEDSQHNMWLSTTNGLSNIKIGQSGNQSTFSFTNFDESDGLQGMEFNESAFYSTKKGELIFGGANGFNIFYPQKILSSANQPLLAFTELQVGNQEVTPSKKIDGRNILTKSIAETREVRLNYDENVFSIDFTAIAFFNPDKVKIKYKLEGFDKNWITVDNKNRRATYTNIAPGNYTFKLATVNNADTAGKQLNLAIVVSPPFYQTTLAYFTYIMLFVAAIFWMRHKGIKKIHAEFTLQREREQAQRLHELDLMKIKFFTNVSHEFRTPLSLILAPVNRLLSETGNIQHIQQLQLVNRNARRLLNMVNQLLDFRKMEEQELKIQLETGDIVAFIKDTTGSFNDVAEKKAIDFTFDSDHASFITEFDHDKLERILFNLISNAFKFTADNGNVTVLLSFNKLNASQQFEMEIRVIDIGIGIPQDKTQKIFERFFQDDVPGSMVNQGSGIGLAITKEFVNLHDGEITVESVVGEGSCFIVKIPLVQKQGADVVVGIVAPQPVAILSKGGTTVKKKPVLLVVEDHDDFRLYLKDSLTDFFNVIDAKNGKEGWQKALALHPDLIISDISMPEMNGIDLCKKLKNDNRTHHIPVVLLTALTGEEYQLNGLETGANDYLTKPFNFEILLSKLKNILSQQELMQSTYKKQVELNPSEVISESPDDLFIQKALQVIEQNISNVEFSVEELSSETCMSRVTLYKKTLALTGKSPVELIRTVRLKRAAQLLSNDHLTVSQVCYRVGFRSHKYFAKSFKAEFGVLPSGYRDSMLANADEILEHC